jgi:hypothetical protein
MARRPRHRAAVDDAWRGHVDDAMAVLRTMREPDQTMARAGDPLVWEAMVLAALRQRAPDFLPIPEQAPERKVSAAGPSRRP